MKKKVFGVLAAMLVLVMGTTTAFAANSPTAEDVLVSNLNSSVTGVTVNGQNTSVTTSKVSKETYQDANTEKKNQKDQIIAMTDISTTSSTSGSVTVVLSVPGVRPTDKVYVMHLRTIGAGTEWEYLTPNSIGNGTVTVTMSSLSPVIVVKEPGTTASAGSSSSGGSSSGSSSSGGTSSSGGSSVTVPSTDDKLIDELNSSISQVKLDGQNASVTTTKVKKADYQNADAKKQSQSDKIIAMTDISGISVTSGKVTVVLSVPGLRSTDKVYVMHLRTVGATTEWEYLIPNSVGDGTVTVTMSSFSPVYVVKQSGTGSGTTNSPVTGGDTDKKDPDDIYDNGYNDGYDAGLEDGYKEGIEDGKDVDMDGDKDTDKDTEQNIDKDNNSSSNNSSNTSNKNNGASSATGNAAASTTVTSPKTGAALPALPFIAMFAAAGVAVCGKKARKSN